MDIGERLLNIVSYNVSKNKKKKCHSNRKLQRFRRQCYKKGMPVEEIERLISMKNTELPTRQDVQGIFDEQMDVSSQVNTTNSPVGMPTLSENQVGFELINSNSNNFLSSSIELCQSISRRWYRKRQS